DAGVVIPVDEYLSEADVADIHEGLWSRYTYRDGRWAIPFQSSTPGLWFNATMMKAAGLDPENPPRTWDDVVAAGKAMTKDTNGDGQIDQWGFGTCDDIPWYQRPMVLQAGGTLVDPEGKVAVNSPEAVEMLTWFKDAVHTHKISPPLAQQTARDDFSAGKYGMVFCSTASRLSFQEDVGDTFELGVAFLPENQRRAVGVGGNALIAVRTGDDAREAAAKTFVQWLTDTERAVGISLDSGYVPIRESALADARIVELTRTDPLVATIYDQLQYVADSSISPADSLIWDGFLNGVETVQTDPQADPQAVLDALQGEIDDYMSTYE
ncbi:MAG: ABC transporter substrate-binding protein, partial [Chloroflexia bacterium]|nr:ABC transporter substrate-binding protein [Chloroflexia bacterium]